VDKKYDEDGEKIQEVGLLHNINYLQKRWINVNPIREVIQTPKFEMRRESRMLAT
jgi:hypothetical protein